ncbi:multiubiquitin domain-containing protein [Bradyrhizobium yuanmingense]|uniref:multiubiquitin domain-containing protein n=1 Tax=Bradyrhizobium yuanmingense TaxID=108015 RepID=UPI0023B8A5F2|nr:multiubiquitin domain-containing protein [Bradyrhizobium yuanmingense]MDF0584784.1 multiubiquitin domain-containing protein [Bradyrhizobium yuanmingense]
MAIDILEAEGSGHSHLVKVKVNEHPVKLLPPHQTGEQIKIAAMEQGVEIDKHYSLDLVLDDGTHHRIEDGERVELHDHMVFVARKPEHIVVVTVNEQPVSLKGHSATGSEIKAAAIAQGVAIQSNFVLQEELPNGTSRIVGDNDVVHLREHLRFTAIAPDDNS